MCGRWCQGGYASRPEREFVLLPQTGAKENIASEVLGMLSVGLGALTAGFASKRRKKNR